MCQSLDNESKIPDSERMGACEEQKSEAAAVLSHISIRKELQLSYVDKISAVKPIVSFRFELTSFRTYK